jgi:hypothetical protein
MTIIAETPSALPAAQNSRNFSRFPKKMGCFAPQVFDRNLDTDKPGVGYT